MNASLALSPVSFHDHTLFIVAIEGEPFTPMKPIVEGMGLNWQTQHRKLVANKDRFCIVIMTIQMPDDDQARETLCMPVRKLPAYFSSVNPGKVGPEIKDKILMYQNECDDALWDYWTKGQATRHGHDDQAPLPTDQITPAQRRHLHDVMDAKCSILPKDLGGKARAEGWSRVGRKFRVAKYEQITQAQFDEALNYLINMEFRAALPEAKPRLALPAPGKDLKAMSTEYYHAVMDLSYQWNKLVANVERLGKDLAEAIAAAALSLPGAGSSPEAIVAQHKFQDALKSSPRCASRSMDVSILALIDHAQFLCGLTLLGR